MYPTHNAESDHPRFKPIDLASNNAQKEVKEDKTKKAAQMLGCGGFAAFTTYVPDSHNPKHLHDSNKKHSKHADNVHRKHSTSLSVLPGADQDPPSATYSPSLESKDQVMCFWRNVETLNNAELKKIFEVKQGGHRPLEDKAQEFPAYKELTLDHETAEPKGINLDTDPINVITSEFLRELRCILNKDPKVKAEPTDTPNAETSDW
jgi:hypothetical protein